MISAQAARTFALASASRSARITSLHARTLATIPDPQHPTDKPLPNDKPGSNSTLLILLGGTAVAVGGWWYSQGSSADPHESRKQDEERVKQKAAELRDAGKATAHDAAKEGQEAYDDTKAAAKGKLAQARAEADAAATAAQNTLNAYKTSAVQSIDHAKASAAATYNDAAHKASDTYHDAAHKVEDTTQSWGSWFGSWFGYGKAKAEDVKKEGAQKVAEGADKVEREAQKKA